MPLITNNSSVILNEDNSCYETGLYSDCWADASYKAKEAALMLAKDLLTNVKTCGSDKTALD